MTGRRVSWRAGRQEHASNVISDDDLALAPVTFAHNTPTTKEGCYIRKIFHSHFPNNKCVVAARRPSRQEIREMRAG